MAAMAFTMKLSFNDAQQVRKALVGAVATAKLAATARLATDEERLEAGRTVITLEGILRRDYGDYDEDETRPQHDPNLTDNL